MSCHYVGDGNQSPGGIKDSKLAQRLRSELMRHPLDSERARKVTRQPTSVWSSPATALWQGPDLADAHLFGFLCVCCFPLLLVCLSSFTDWCLVHRKQSHEQKKRCGGCLVPHRNSQFWKCFLPYGSDHCVLRLQVFPAQRTTMGDADFVAWVLRVAPAEAKLLQGHCSCCSCCL